MSPPGPASLPRLPERPPRLPLWSLFRRAAPSARRRSRLRWGRVCATAAGFLVLVSLALGLAWASLGPARSPFEGLLPAETPLALEGEAAAVLELLRRTPPLGPQALEDFGLSLRGSAGKRMLFALLPRGSADAADACRRRMAGAVAELENGWEGQQAYPSRPPAYACPSGGQAGYRLEGEDFVLECRGPSHVVTYDSRGGFDAQAEGGPVVLVGLERPPEEGGLQLLCSRPELLDRQLASTGPRLAFPGPADAALRGVGRVQAVEALVQGPWPPLPEGGRVQFWGDPAEERWSVRLPLATSEPGGLGQVAEALGELPAAPVALAAAPGFLRLLAPATARELALEGSGAPGVLAVAMEEPVTREGWREQVARLLAGRTGAVVSASFTDGERMKRWLGSTPWAGALTGGSPGTELETRGAAARVRLGGWGGEALERPALPPGEGEAALAGWLTVSGPKGRRALYCVSAGPGDGEVWVEVRRHDAPAAPATVARDETPVIQSR